jgi:hypothetical protein
MDAGTVYVYELDGATAAVPVAVLSKPGAAVGDLFGYSVVIEGTTIVVGAPFDDMNATDRGAAYIFGLPQPILQLTRGQQPGVAELAWTPFDTAGFVLQYSPSLSAPSWVDVPTDGLNPLSILTTNTSGFYRMVRP